jgi:hypothetical protein
MRPKHPERYITAEQIFEYLLSIYKDANKLKNTKKNFRNLIIYKCADYQIFKTKFLHLAGEAEIPTANYKNEFMDKLLFDLQKMVATKHAKDRIFIEFCKIVAQSAYTLKMINKAQKPCTPRNPNSLNKPNEPRKPSPASAAPKGHFALPLDKKDRAALLKFGSCFYCKKQSYLFCNCLD